MRHFIVSTVFLLATFLGAAHPAAADSVTADNIFATIGGATTLDRGGAIHSQARSIYSLGGGMSSFQGKRLTLLAADPPSFSAGCSGISWHFGGFAFISVDEIRQLVESISQASLGVAVDLAMQTLCPQCYAVMSKLRDIANQMRNAAADSCKVAKNFGALLSKQMPGLFKPTSVINNCSEAKAENNEADSFMGGTLNLCKTLTDAQTELGKMGDAVNNFLNGQPTADGKTPSKQQLDAVGNMTYQALTALGYKDGFVKDILLSYLGMEIIPAKPANDCKEAFAEVRGSAKTDSVPNPAAVTDPDARAEVTAQANLMSSFDAGTGESGNAPSLGNPTVTVVAADDVTPPTFADTVTQEATTTPTGTKTAKQVCHAPPVLKGVDEVAWKLICGFDPDADALFFETKFPNTHISNGSLNAMCGKSVRSQIYKTAAGSKDKDNPFIYHCDKTSAECMHPKMQRLSDAVMGAAGASGYTGLAWQVLDALYSGVDAVVRNDPDGLPKPTLAILNGSGYPLYRLINLAAVYPVMSDELLQAYGAIIAVHYAMDTLTKLAMPGANVQFTLIPVKGDVGRQELLSLQSNIMNMLRLSGSAADDTLKRLNEKRALVDVIVQVNKALQADVISQGLGGNADLAVSLKKQLAAKP